MKKIISLMVGVLAAVSLGACSQVSKEDILAEVEHPFEVIRAEETLMVGETLQLKVTNGEDATWTTSDPAVATVSDKGLVTAVSAGEVVIKAKIGEVQKEFALTVEALPAPAPAPKYHGFTLEELNAIPCEEDFAKVSNQTWNLGWDVASPEATAAKCDITLGTPSNHDGVAAIHATPGSMVENGAWCAGLYARPAYNGEAAVTTTIYDKINLSDAAVCTQFRIWGCFTAFPWRAGNGNLKVTALVVQDDVVYERNLPITNYVGGGNPTTEGTFKVEKDGSYSWSVPATTAKENVPVPGYADGDGMMIFDISSLKALGMYGQCTIVIDFNAGDVVLNSEDANTINNFGVDTLMQSNFGLKRMLFC